MNQIDYITVNKRFRNSLLQVKTCPGADCAGGRDHVSVVTEMRVKFKINKNKKVRKDWFSKKKRGRSKRTAYCKGD